MLSRTAEMFFWIGRYIERAEYTARLTDIHYEVLLEASEKDEPTIDWTSYLEIRGELETYQALYADTQTSSVLEFLVLNEKNPNALVNLVKMARENARSVQDQLTSEVWHHLNGFHLGLKNRPASELRSAPHQLLNHIKTECYTMAGVFRSTMLRDEGWTFYRLGKNIERTGHTARLLLSPVLMKTSSDPGALREYQQCIAILKSASAYQGYRRVYGGNLVPKKIVQFLLFHDRFPRSIRFSVQLVRALLSELSGPTHNPLRRGTERLAGQLVADLEYSSIEEVYKIGLPSFITEITEYLDQVSNGVGHVFFRATGKADQPSPTIQRRRRLHPEVSEPQVQATKAVLSIRHRFVYSYESTVSQVRTLMRLAPPQHYGRQRRLDISWHMDPSADYRHFTDAFGNLVWQLDHVDVKEISCIVEMRIETEALYGMNQELVFQGITAQESDCAVDPIEFTRLTALVDHSETMAQWVAHLRERALHAAEMAETILHQVSAHMSYEAGHTDIHTKASEAFALGKGVCQDYAHIMLSLCRESGLPARYVSGYLPGEGQMHAWVEVLIPVGPEHTPTWVAYDPTHQCRVDERYTTVGIGRDYQDIAPTSGFYSGEAKSHLFSEVTVIIETQGPADRVLRPSVIGPTTHTDAASSQQQQ